MRTTHSTSISLSLAATALLALSGCDDAAQTSPVDTDSLDGVNVDGTPAKPTGEAKADAWDYRNDPAAFARFAARDFKYTLADLPKDGASANTPWPDTYWPTYQDGINARYTGDEGVNGFSPAEKYDLAFNGWMPDAEFAALKPYSTSSCMGAFDKAYYDKLGPLARYISTKRGNAEARDGVDSDDDMKIDECDGDGYDGVETWWGLCHAWVPAALNEPEPIHPIEFRGVTFYPSDIKALMMQAYNRSRSMILGGRCNTKTPERDETGRIKDPACRDTNAGSFHVVVTNMLGRHKMAFAEDRTYDYQVWNQPVFKYEVTKQEEIDVKKALELIGSKDADYSKINVKAKRFAEVQTRLYYVTESEASKSPKVPEISAYTRTDNYRYVLELDEQGAILGGEWILGTSTHPAWGQSFQPDFLWFSTGPVAELDVPLDYDHIKELLELSRKPIAEPTDGQAGEGTAFAQLEEVDTVIPDNDRTGISRSLKIDRTDVAAVVSVQLDITHPYVGDLRIELLKDGASVKVLWEKRGGGADDIHEVIPVTELNDKPLNGEYTLKVVDGARVDEGKLARWGIVAELKPAN